MLCCRRIRKLRGDFWLIMFAINLSVDDAGIVRGCAIESDAKERFATCSISMSYRLVTQPKLVDQNAK